MAADAFHSAMLLAVPDTTAANTGLLGGGTIVTRDRIVTTATLAEGAQLIRAWFYRTDMNDPTDVRQTRSVWIQTMPGYDWETRANDIAVVMFPTNIFPVANMIPVRATAAPTAGTAASMAGWGFVNGDAVAGTRQPLLAAHAVQDCAAPLASSASHFCALATAPAVVCPGDIGNGLWVTVDGQTPPRALVSWIGFIG